jgi:hypothetical protein
MKKVEKTEITITMSSDIVREIEKVYGKKVYSQMIENLFRIQLPNCDITPLLPARFHRKAAKSKKSNINME